jgi:hypothetical protein
MIQRIQSLYLLLGSHLLLILYFFPIALPEIDGSNSAVFFYRTTNENISFIFPLSANLFPSVISFLSAIIAIFYYKRRSKQIFFTQLAMFAALIIPLFAIILFNFGKKTIIINWNFQFTIAIPVISATLFFLAIRRIKADDELIRSIDRIR